MEVDINVMAAEEDGVESIEKTSKKKKKLPVDIEPEVRQGE